MKEFVIKKLFDDDVLNLVADTLEKGKQALVFVNAKRSAEKVAEDLAKNLGVRSKELDDLAMNALNVLSKSTRQCERLAVCLKKGFAFHHSGLASEQRELVEENFRNGSVKIIACTPTLAAGLDLPAFRSIIRDVKRFSQRGMDFISVIEFLQMAGRAGRPKYDSFGEAIVIVNSESQKELIHEKYVNGFPEDITSKLAVEPVLRTYVLSLIASNIINSEDQIDDFFSKTFYAFQYENSDELKENISKVLKLLKEWNFIKFIDEKYFATYLGRRVSELYIDPLTAEHFSFCLKRVNDSVKSFALLQAVCNTLEMRPLLSVKKKEFDELQEKILKIQEGFIDLEPSEFEPEYDDWLNSVKTCFMFEDWINELGEDELLEKYDIRPGELKVKLENIDWLLYSFSEIARIQKFNNVLKEFYKLRVRIKYGSKEELLSLLKFKGIGRVRARKMFNSGLKDLKDVKECSNEKLSILIGKQNCESVKKQLVNEELMKNLKDYN